MRRAVLFVVLCLVLLAQHRGYVHPIAHLAEHAGALHEATFSVSQADQPCVECELIAGGFNFAPGAFASLAHGEKTAGLVFHSYHSRAGEVPAWFRSRAPPVLL